MFRIEYNLEIDGEQYHCTYPQTEEPHSNIFILKGKNDSGKTTTLSLIALAFYGKKYNDYLPNIDKLEFLHEKTKFRIKLQIKSLDEKFEVMVAYSNYEKNFTSYMINNKPVGLTELLDHVQVLYEVPDSPLKKLQTMLNQLVKEFDNYENYCFEYERTLSRLGEEVKKFEEAKNKSQEINAKISELNDRLNSLMSTQKILKEELDGLERDLMTYKYDLLMTKKSLIEARIDNLDKQKSDSRAEQAKHLAWSEATNKLNELKVMLKPIPSSLQELGLDLNVSELQRHVEEFNGMQVNTVISSKARELMTYIMNDLNTFQNLLRSKQQKKLSQSPEFELLNELEKLLSKYLSTYPNISVLKGKTVIALYNEIKERLASYSHIRDLEKTIQALDFVSKELKTFQDYIRKNSSKLVQKESTITLSPNEIDSLIKQLKEQLEDINSEIGSIPEKYKRRGSPPGLVIQQDIEKRYNEKKREYEDINQRINNTKVDLATQEALLSQYSKIAMPETRLTLSDINARLNTLYTLKRKLNEHKRKVLDLIDGKFDKKDEDFYRILGEHLALNIKEIYHNHKTFRIAQINLLDGYYLTEEGERIDFNSIGSGTSALNSLLIRLSQESTKRLIILVDEIGDMDKENLDIFIRKATQYTKSGKVILTLMTRPDSDSETAVCQPVKFGE